MIEVTINSLLKYFNESGREATLQEETQQIYRILAVAGKEFPLFIRIFDQSSLLQLLVFMPSKIKAGTHGDLARLLHHMNKELDLPGFGMDENNEVVFYRCMLPTPQRKIQKDVLESFLKSIEVVCESFSPAILAVATGQTTYSEILQKVGA